MAARTATADNVGQALAHAGLVASYGHGDDEETARAWLTQWDNVGIVLTEQQAHYMREGLNGTNHYPESGCGVESYEIGAFVLVDFDTFAYQLIRLDDCEDLMVEMPDLPDVETLEG